MNTPDMKANCVGHVAALKYALAGDMESVDLLAQLLDRLRLIQWEDPDFVQKSEEMRSPIPTLTPEQEAALQPSLLALLHVQAERIALSDEIAAAQIPFFRNALEQQKINNEQSKQLCSLLQTLSDLHVRMREKLQMLGADSPEYDIPPEAWPKP